MAELKGQDKVDKIAEAFENKSNVSELKKRCLVEVGIFVLLFGIYASLYTWLNQFRWLDAYRASLEVHSSGKTIATLVIMYLSSIIVAGNISLAQTSGSRVTAGEAMSAARKASKKPVDAKVKLWSKICSLCDIIVAVMISTLLPQFSIIWVGLVSMVLMCIFEYKNNVVGSDIANCMAIACLVTSIY